MRHGPLHLGELNIQEQDIQTGGKNISNTPKPSRWDWAEMVLVLREWGKGEIVENVMTVEVS